MHYALNLHLTCVIKPRFYFAYCEASFDARYIHNFHLTWVKNEPGMATGALPGGASAAAPAVFNVSATSVAAEALSRELPSDPITQVCVVLRLYVCARCVCVLRLCMYLCAQVRKCKGGRAGQVRGPSTSLPLVR